MEAWTLLSSLSDRAQEYPSVVLSVAFAVLYALYYLLCVVKRPVIACGDEKLRQFIDQHCPISREKFWPTWWCIESHAQTIMRAVLQSAAPISYSQEFVKTPDGGEIRLDWADSDLSLYTSDLRPTVLFMPGLTGSSRETYILHLVDLAGKLGYRSVVFNNRGTGDTNLKTPRFFCAANIDDTKLVVSHIRGKYPDSPLMGVGVSLGGIILFNYLATVGSQTDILAAMIVSPAYDLIKSCNSLERPLNYWMFNRHLAHGLCGIIRRNLQIYENHLDIDTKHVLKSGSIKDFDERLTSKIFGFESADHYYTEASLHTKMHSLAKPVLCLSSADDPFAPDSTIPTKGAEENPNIAIVKTSHGGHIGFLEGTFPSSKNYMYKWFRQFTTAIFFQEMKSE